LKIKSFILLFSFAVYLFDTLAAFSGTDILVEEKSICHENMTPKEAPDEGCPEQSKNCVMDCYSCPIFYVSTLAKEISVAAVSPEIEIHYRTIEKSLIPGYYTPLWKPPDVV